MLDEPENTIKPNMEGFYLSEINSKQLLLYVTALKLKGDKATKSGVVNDALALFFETHNSGLDLAEVAG